MGAPRIDRLEKNLLINGNFDYWQRGTTVSGASLYGADRWRGNSAITSQERYARASWPLMPAGSRYGNRLTSAVGGGDMAQRIESANLVGLAGKYITVSVKAGLLVGTTTIQFYVRKANATDNFSSSTVVLQSSVFPAPVLTSAGYSTYKYTFQLDQDMCDKGIAIGIQGDLTVWSVVFCQAMAVIAPDSNDFMPDVYVYAGRDLANELIICQRYYEKSYNLENPPGSTGDPGAVAWPCPQTNNVTGSFFKVRKRSNPIVTLYNPATGAVGMKDFVTGGNLTYGSIVAINETGWGYASAGTLGANAGYGHFTADAEL